MAKRGLIIGGGLVVLLGIGCLGLTTIGGVGAWFVFRAQPDPFEERIYSEFGDHSGPRPVAEPVAVTPEDVLVDEADTDVDTQADTEVDTEAATVQAAVTTSSSRPRSTSRASTAPAPRPFSAPGEAEEPIPEEENLDDIDLERTAIEIIDEELTPRERRRLRRQEGRN